ncbi:MAG: SDR family oxidoreductase [Nitrospirae bacterium]|nr:SDR family oxidoreductase [Nitrospirota bacterium]
MTASNKILIIGATSAIAYETAKIFAKHGSSLYLCARDEHELKRLADDLLIRGAKEVCFSHFDALSSDSIISSIDTCLEKYPDLDGLLIAHGTLPDQHLCEQDIDEMERAVRINFTSSAAILTYIAPYFEQLGHGCITVISSVAGDRGRQSNYVYGSAKGAMSIFLSGLRQRLHKAGVSVVTIKPGFVDTPMTANIAKNFLFAKPDVIASGIYKAFYKSSNTVYLPWFWRWIMLIIRNIPEVVFLRIRL